MSNSRMVDAVNRLVGTLLAGSGEVFLPGVGSLYTERCPARRVSKKSVVPPCRVVSFSSQPRGASLVDKIAEAAKVGAEQAEEIYQIWLSRTRKEEVLTIEGVGELKFKNFTLAPEFDAELNPQGHEPVRIKSPKRFEWPLWLGVAAIVFVAVAGGYQYWVMNYAGRLQAVTVAEPEVVAEEVVAADSAQEVVVTTEGVDSVSQAATTPVTEVTPTAADPQSPSALESGCRYVVLGVFSTLENARNAAGQTHIPCRIYTFGSKFMVSPFESDADGACAEFIRAHSERFPELWIHVAR